MYQTSIGDNVQNMMYNELIKLIQEVETNPKLQEIVN